MAAVTVKNDSGIFWINDTSDEDQQVAFVPGVSRERSLRTAFKAGSGSAGSERKLKMRAKSGSESRSESSMRTSSKKRGQPLNLSLVEPTKGKGVLQSTPSPVVRSPTQAIHNLLATPLAISETSQAKSKASLKDLCSEDKRRIANLIQELARVSEEKEESVQRLRDEQESFERKIQQLEQQNQLIIQERGSLQQQYRECQELLGLYQQYLSQQQEKLNQSIAQLSHARSKREVASSEESSTRPAARGVDGSASEPYRAAPGAGTGEAGSFSGSASPSDHYRSATPPPPPHSSSSSSEREHPPAAQGALERRGGRSEPRPASHRRHRRGHQTDGYGAELENDVARGKPCEDDGGGGRHTGSPRADPMGPEAKGALTAPLLGREDWEEKRHRLLLQKMQLEVERERLQARLAQQEERLIRQNQHLRQSRLDYSRFQQATAAELGGAISRDGIAQPGRDPLPNGHAVLSELRDGDGAEGSGEADRPHKDAPTLIPPQNDVYNHESPLRSRRDLATSPAVSQSRLKASLGPAMPLAMPRTPHARLDSSLIELLEVFSPISGPELCPSSTQRRKPPLHQPPLSAPRPARHALLSPSHGHYARTPQQDLEESQILEEIFFIC